MPVWFDKLVGKQYKQHKKATSTSWLRTVLAGSFYKMSDLRGESSIADIKTQIDTMRALAADSQISTALSYYATDATTTNTNNQIIWATAVDKNNQEAADIVNSLFDRWNINAYARDHILELATIGNLYIPTTDMYKEPGENMSKGKFALDSNSISDNDFDIVPSYKVPPEDIAHLWYQGKPQGYIFQPEDDSTTTYVVYPESSIIHFSLGGLLGDYTLDTQDKHGDVKTFDIQFAHPLMDKAVQPTQTLSLLEDSMILSSLTRVVKFINIECGNAEEEELRQTLQEIKDAIEQQLSLNTNTGDVQSFVNPQSPNNLIYLPKINGQDAISVTDLNMTEATETDNKLLNYYQDKKLSVVGVPKEAMNFSSAEGLGNAGSVMSQRSALYSNSLMRLETSYKEGWRDALNKYFVAKNLSGFVDKFELHMNPIVTEMSALNFDKRDSALSQAQSIVDLLTSLGVTHDDEFKIALTEILSEVLPTTGASVNGWDIAVENTEGDELSDAIE